MLWSGGPSRARAARLALDSAAARGGLIISAPVYAELLAGPGRTEAFVDGFLADSGIQVDWMLGEAVWRAAGRGFQTWVRNRPQKRSAPRRILADFLVGAHAILLGEALLTLDPEVYRPVFPGLRLLSF